MRLVAAAGRFGFWNLPEPAGVFNSGGAMKMATDYSWRVRYPRSGATAYFETRQAAEEEADGNGWAEPIVEAYVLGIGWVPAAKVGK